MTEELELSKGKTVGDLGRDVLWFSVHTLLAMLVLALVVGVMTLTRPDPLSPSPKILATALAILVPMIAGFIIARIQGNRVARYIWISGLMLFAAVCVWVIDLPTGNGLCENCHAMEKLWRTFFAINHGSGLMGGDGLLVGTWVPLSMIGYAAGAGLGLSE